MTLLEIWGWVCGIFGATTALPQLRRLLVTRSSAGLSLIGWQLNVAALSAWTSHGLITGRANLIVTNLSLAITMAAILVLIVKDRGLTWLRSLFPVLIVLAGLVSIELLLGELVFGVVIVVPSAAAWVAQLVDLIRRPDISGVSVGMLLLNVVLQYMWVSWAFFAGDRAVLLVANVMGFIALLNLIAFVIRRAGRSQARALGGTTGQDFVPDAGGKPGPAQRCELQGQALQIARGARPSIRETLVLGLHDRVGYVS